MRNFMGFIFCSIALLGCGRLKPLGYENTYESKSVAAENREQKTKVLDSSSIDVQTNPCENFYQYACEEWIKNTPLSRDQAVVYRTDFFLKKNIREKLTTALEDYAPEGHDLSNAESKTIDEIRELKTLPIAIARLHSLNIQSLFYSLVEPALLDSTQNIISLDMGGWTLDQCKAYLGEDPESTDTREHHLERMIRFFVSLGMDTKTAQSTSNAVLELEKKLAMAASSSVEKTHPKVRYEVVSLERLSKLTPSFDWNLYLSNLRVLNPASVRIILGSIDFPAALEKILSTVSLDVIKAYLKWQLSEEFAPRIDDPATKSGAEAMAIEIQHAFLQKIEHLIWLDASSRAKAKEKIEKIALLSPPNYSLSASEPENYGSTGTTIAFEISRAISFEGSFYDSQGNYKDWWSNATQQNFEKHLACLVDQASAYEFTLPSVGDATKTEQVSIRGIAVLDQNIADQASAVVALEAYKSRHPQASLQDLRDYFTAYAQAWCEKRTPESLRRQLEYSEEPPSEFRVNGVLSNMGEFQAAFSCKEGEKMVHTTQERCALWSGQTP